MTTSNPVPLPDSLPRFPSLTPYGLTFGSTKQRNRRWRINQDNWLFEDNDSVESFVTTRSSSTSSVPVLHGQMRSAAPDGSVKISKSPTYRGPPNSRSVSQFSANYGGDNSVHLLHDSHRRCVSVNKLNDRHATQPSLIELNVEKPLPDGPKSEPRPRRVSSRSYPTTTPPKMVTLTVTRKPVASLVNRNSADSPTYDILRSSLFSISDMDMEGGLELQVQEKLSPKSPFESIWDQTPPETPSPPPRTTAAKIEPDNSVSEAIAAKTKDLLKELPGISRSSSQTSSSRQSVSSASSKSSGKSSGSKESFPRFMVIDPFPYFISVIEYLYNIITADSFEMGRTLMVLVSKVLFVLYLASCMWSVVTAVHGAILKAIEPILICLKVVTWVFGH